MKHLIFVLLTLFSVLGFAKPSQTVCERALAGERARVSSSRSYYRAILSTDLNFLNTEARFADGPAPQRNVSIVTPLEQFHFNGETEEILRLKERLIARFGERIIKVKPGFEAAIQIAVREQFGMMLDELPVAAPHIYRREGGALVNGLTNYRLTAFDLTRVKAEDALEKLGRMVPEDLVFMKKVGDEYILIGGNLAFPTDWSLESTLGWPTSTIHSHTDTTPEKSAAFSKMINQVLDRTLLTKDVVRRNNWFLETDPRYARPNYRTTEFNGPQRIDARNYKNSVFVRMERQTLRGLPQSQTVVFAIQPIVYSAETFLKAKDGARKLMEGIKVKLLPEEDRHFVKSVAKFLERDVELSPTTVSTRVLSNQFGGDGLRILRVARPDGLNVGPGEAVRVTLNTKTGPVSRTLSLASSPERPYLEFAVRESESDFKAAFKELTLNAEVELEFSRTSLGFRLDRPAVLIAGGIGITPFRSFIQQAQDLKRSLPMWLYFGNRSEIPFKEELEAAAAVLPNLKMTNVVGERINEDYLSKVLPQLPPNAMFYIAGAPQMTADIESALLALGISPDRISVERFSGYQKANGGEDQTICYCHRVSERTIREAVASGVQTLAQIQAATKASTGCGGCKDQVLKFLEGGR